ncbi:MAG TPA: fatty acid desaturase, partial [Afifellaceae bacterium]|nr:fatty acid desaturase [Afifellaceae bacterium]
MTLTNAVGASAEALSAKDWISILTPYREQSRVRSISELAMTAGLFAISWLVMLASLQVGYWLTLILAVPTAGLLIRMFLIQHDCGHGAFFRRKATNDWIGRALGVFTLTPYDPWRRSHAIHHASSGNLERRGIGDVKTMTVREYKESSWLRKVQYRLYRHPLILFGIGPVYQFLVEHRLPVGYMRDGWAPWVSTMATNIVLAGIVALLMWTVGVVPFLMVHVPVIILAACIGVWLFYVQHQFDETHWEHEEDWDVHEAAFHGSSHYDLPVVLRWFTANIGAHHIHHLCARIPFYRLYEVIGDHPELATIGRLTFWESIRCVKL